MEAQKVNREKLEGGSICGVNVFYFCFSLFSPNLIVLSPRTNALIPTVDSRFRVRVRGNLHTRTRLADLESCCCQFSPFPFSMRGRGHITSFVEGVF